LLADVAQAYLPIISSLQFSRIAGLPYAAIPIATAISLAGNYPMIYPRKEVKTYGTKAEIEGDYHAARQSSSLMILPRQVEASSKLLKK